MHQHVLHSAKRDVTATVARRRWSESGREQLLSRRERRQTRIDIKEIWEGNERRRHERTHSITRVTSSSASKWHEQHDSRLTSDEATFCTLWSRIEIHVHLRVRYVRYIGFLRLLKAASKNKLNEPKQRRIARSVKRRACGVWGCCFYCIIAIKTTVGFSASSCEGRDERGKCNKNVKSASVKE